MVPENQLFDFWGESLKTQLFDLGGFSHSIRTGERQLKTMLPGGTSGFHKPGKSGGPVAHHTISAALWQALNKRMK